MDKDNINLARSPIKSGQMYQIKHTVKFEFQVLKNLLVSHSMYTKNLLFT